MQNKTEALLIRTMWNHHIIDINKEIEIVLNKVLKNQNFIQNIVGNYINDRGLNKYFDSRDRFIDEEIEKAINFIVEQKSGYSFENILKNEIKDELSRNVKIKRIDLCKSKIEEKLYIFNIKTKLKDIINQEIDTENQKILLSGNIKTFIYNKENYLDSEILYISKYILRDTVFDTIVNLDKKIETIETKTIETIVSNMDMQKLINDTKKSIINQANILNVNKYTSHINTAVSNSLKSFAIETLGKHTNEIFKWAVSTMTKLYNEFISNKFDSYKEEILNIGAKTFIENNLENIKNDLKKDSTIYETFLESAEAGEDFMPEIKPIIKNMMIANLELIHSQMPVHIKDEIKKLSSNFIKDELSISISRILNEDNELVRQIKEKMEEYESFGDYEDYEDFYYGTISKNKFDKKILDKISTTSPQIFKALSFLEPKSEIKSFVIAKVQCYILNIINEANEANNEFSEEANDDSSLDTQADFNEANDEVLENNSTVTTYGNLNITINDE